MAKRVSKRVGKTRRYLVIGDVVHHLYETEDGHHRTQCRLITREGEVVRAQRTPECGKLCRACCNAVTSLGHVNDTVEDVSKRPTKTRGRKRQGSVRGTSSW